MEVDKKGEIMEIDENPFNSNDDDSELFLFNYMRPINS